jgi:hypothetical protein
MQRNEMLAFLPSSPQHSVHPSNSKCVCFIKRKSRSKRGTEKTACGWTAEILKCLHCWQAANIMMWVIGEKMRPTPSLPAFADGYRHMREEARVPPSSCLLNLIRLLTLIVLKCRKIMFILTLILLRGRLSSVRPPNTPS